MRVTTTTLSSSTTFLSVSTGYRLWPKSISLPVDLKERKLWELHHTGTVCSLLREVRLEEKKPKATLWPSNGYVKKNLLRPTVGFHGRLRWGSAEFIKRAKNKNRARVFKKDSIYLLFSRGIKKYICIYQ